MLRWQQKHEQSSRACIELTRVDFRRLIIKLQKFVRSARHHSLYPHKDILQNVQTQARHIKVRRRRTRVAVFAFHQSIYFYEKTFWELRPNDHGFHCKHIFQLYYHFFTNEGHLVNSAESDQALHDATPVLCLHCPRQTSGLTYNICGCVQCIVYMRLINELNNKLYKK